MKDWVVAPLTSRASDCAHLVPDAVRLLACPAQSPALSLVTRLCHALAEEEINYCHWKSNNAIDRSARGENDLDLLVSRSDAGRFAALLGRLGFKQVQAPAGKRMPGVLDYYGYDEEGDRLIHAHVHYQLVLGHDTTKNYRLPIEKAYLASSVQRDLFRVPAAEFEFIVFVVRMVLKHATWDAIMAREGRLKKTERQELDYLQACVHQGDVVNFLNRHLPCIGAEFFDRCLRALQPGCSAWVRVRVGQQLQVKLQANARRPFLVDSYLRLWRRAASVLRRRISKTAAGYRLQSGGAMIAIVGADGAGKSTVIDGFCAWLSTDLEVARVHMGKPAWSWTTIAIRGVLKAGHLLGLYPAEASFRETLHQRSMISPGYPWLIREVCRARDRYSTYVRARRLAARGGLVIFDRFPLPGIQLMDGPQGERFIDELMAGQQGAGVLSPHAGARLARSLIRLETSYYRRIAWPEVLVVLRIDPQTALRRKPEDDALAVRERATEIWQRNWEGTGAFVLDASQSKADVLCELKRLVWAEL